MKYVSSVNYWCRQVTQEEVILQQYYQGSTELTLDQQIIYWLSENMNCQVQTAYQNTFLKGKITQNISLRFMVLYSVKLTPN